MVAYVLAIAPKVGAAFVDFCIEEFKFCEDLWANGPRSVSSPTGLLGWGGGKLNPSTWCDSWNPKESSMKEHPRSTSGYPVRSREEDI